MDCLKERRLLAKLLFGVRHIRSHAKPVRSPAVESHLIRLLGLKKEIFDLTAALCGGDSIDL